MGAKSKKSSKEKSSKKTSKKASKEKDKSKSSKSKEKSKKSKSPKSKNDSLIIKDEDINDKKPELDIIMLNPNNNLNLDYNKNFGTLDTNINNQYIQIQNGATFPVQTPNLRSINTQISP